MTYVVDCIRLISRFNQFSFPCSEICKRRHLAQTDHDLEAQPHHNNHVDGFG